MDNTKRDMGSESTLATIIRYRWRSAYVTN